ncbi:Zonadhesin [Bienertia sinuspersici]
MVKFESKQSSVGHFLVLKDKIDGDKKTVIPIFPPMTGAFADKWKIEPYPPHLKKWVSGKSPKAILNSSHHHEKTTTKPLSLLYDRISRREVTWSSKPQFGVTFLHIPLYCEWTEDIIRRCKTTLIKTDLIDAVYASMFLYKCNSPLMQRFSSFGALQRIPFSLEMVNLLLACGTFESLAGSPYMAHSTMSNVKELTSAEAKVFIRSEQDINWIGNCVHNLKDRLLIDDSTLRQDADFLLSTRSYFLTLRYDNDHVVEPYSPHRFSCQFGFCQNIPGALKPHLEEPSLQYLWSLFQTSTQVGTNSSFIIPATSMNSEIRSPTTAPFKLWWKTSYSSPGPSPSPPQ